VLRLEPLVVPFDLSQTLQLTDGLQIQSGDGAPKDPVPSLLPPPGEHERVNGEGVRHVPDKDTGLLAELDGP
jgi:hypothetical protein